MKRMDIDYARRIGQEMNANQVVVMLIDDHGTMQSVSWGKDRTHCTAARRFADAARTGIENLILGIENDADRRAVI